MRLIPILVIGMLLILTACPRSQAPDAQRLGGSVAHPWEIPGNNPIQELMSNNRQGSEPLPSDDSTNEIEVALPTKRGPAFSVEDTLDEDLLPGQWLQLCVSMDEKQDLLPGSEMDILELRANHSMVWMVRHEGNDVDYLSGDWNKIGPGQISMAVQDQGAVQLQAQLFNENFLFLWDYNRKLGHWFARFPGDGTERITRNRFDTSYGAMVFTEVGDLGYRGKVQGEYERTIAGLYMPGVMSMRWEEGATNSGGFAAFIVSPDFSTLDGVWWLDDYEASPFGGIWTAIANDNIKLTSETDDDAGSVESEG